jgi:DNA-binding phage protein
MNATKTTKKKKAAVAPVEVENISQVAREAQVDRSHVSLILAKKRMPSFPVAGRIAKAMGITLDELHERIVA